MKKRKDLSFILWIDGMELNGMVVLPALSLLSKEAAVNGYVFGPQLNSNPIPIPSFISFLLSYPTTKLK